MIALVGSTAHAVAQDRSPHWPLSPRHFQNRAWTDEDGAPRTGGNMVQTPDGYLWIASQDGLFRFDGLTFEEVRPPSGSTMDGAAPQSLLVTRSGELWVSYSRSAGVAVYRKGQLVSAGFPNPPAVITNLVEGRDGAIWAEWGGLSRRLWRYQNGHWQQADTTFGLPQGYTLGMVGTPDGSLWVPVQKPDQRSTGIAWLAPGARAFQWLDGAFEMPRLYVDREGALWMADGHEVRLFRDARQKPPVADIRYRLPLDLKMGTLAFDRWGGIWGTARTGEMFRIASARQPADDRSSQIEIFDTFDQPSKIGARLLTDREDTVWTSMDGRLERFRFANVTMDPLVRGDITRGIKLTGTADGIVYALSNQMLFQIKPRSATRALRPVPEPMAMCAAKQAGVWLLDPKRTMFVHADGQMDIIDKAPTLAARCAEDGLSRLWLRGMDGSTWWRDAEGWHRLPGYDAPGGSGIMMGVVANPDGEVAIASEMPGMTIVSGKRLLHYDFRRLGMDELTIINPGIHGFFVGGRRGLLQVRDGQVRKLDARLYPWLAKITGVAQSHRGETWFRSAEGISRVSTAELERAFAHPGAPVSVRLFDSRDGFQGQGQSYGFPTRFIVVGGDGRISTITSKGLAMIDPDRMFDAPLPPKVAIRSLESQSKIRRDPMQLVLPPGSSTVRFVFSTMGLADPERLQARYRLVGLETAWTDPGTRRATTYTNLSPGSYRFEVIAANAAGIWNREGAALDFEIRPTFFQSGLFKLLCVIAALILAWSAYKLRMQAVSTHIQARLAERHDERERIARELHDTLLQSVQALILRFHLATDALAEDAPGRRGLEQTLVQAQNILGETRERVRGLRRDIVPETLEPAIINAGRERGLLPGANLFVTTSGTPRCLDPIAMGEIIRIAEEALFNIVKHAQATRVDVHVDYRPDVVQVTFRDNGVGIHPETLRAGCREGHYGFVGMRERATRLRGDMMFDKASGGGAEVILMVPARMAYGRARHGWLRNPFRRWRG